MEEARKDPNHQMFIGYGYNVSKLGIPFEFAEHLLRKRLAKADADAREFCKDLRSKNEHGEEVEGLNVLSDVRQRVVVNMAYNMGLGAPNAQGQLVGGLAGFKKFREALEKGDYDQAVKQMFDSGWATQVQRNRVLDLAFMMKNDRTFDKYSTEDIKLRNELGREMDSAVAQRKRGPVLNPPT